MQAFLGSMWNLPEPQIQRTSWGWDAGGVWGQAWSAAFSPPHAPPGTHVSGLDGSSKWPGWGGVPFTFPPLFPPCSQKAACAVACGLLGRLRAGPLPFSLGLWGPSRVPWMGVPGLGRRALEEPLGLNLTLPALCLAALQV